jgi:hypothetical protein
LLSGFDFNCAIVKLALFGVEGVQERDDSTSTLYFKQFNTAMRLTTEKMGFSEKILHILLGLERELALSELLLLSGFQGFILHRDIFPRLKRCTQLDTHKSQVNHDLTYHNKPPSVDFSFGVASPRWR